MDTQFGTLEEVSLRQAWPHEANNFTPWLASNLDRISDAIGIPLEHEGSEVIVAGYKADILARNSNSDSRVLIENQLEEGNHLHLGQILTYLAGLQAETVVWVASHFRDAHLSAIRWLNEHTIEPYAFFAIKVRVVRIGLSPFAPLFDVIEQPNTWDRQVQEVVRESRELTEKGAFRRRFWTLYLERHPSAGWTRGGAAHNRARVLPELGLTIVQYIAKNGVGIWIRETTGRDASMLPDTVREALQERLGVAMGRDITFGNTLKLDPKDEVNWERMADWLAEQAERYEAALRELLPSHVGPAA